MSRYRRGRGGRRDTEFAAKTGKFLDNCPYGPSVTEDQLDSAFTTITEFLPTVVRLIKMSTIDVDPQDLMKNSIGYGLLSQAICNSMRVRCYLVGDLNIAVKLTEPSLVTSLDAILSYLREEVKLQMEGQGENVEKRNQVTQIKALKSLLFHLRTVGEWPTESLSLTAVNKSGIPVISGMLRLVDQQVKMENGHFSEDDQAIIEHYIKDEGHDPKKLIKNGAGSSNGVKMLARSAQMHKLMEGLIFLYLCTDGNSGSAYNRIQIYRETSQLATAESKNKIMEKLISQSKDPENRKLLREMVIDRQRKMLDPPLRGQANHWVSCILNLVGARTFDNVRPSGLISGQKYSSNVFNLEKDFINMDPTRDNVEKNIDEKNFPQCVKSLIKSFNGADAWASVCGTDQNFYYQIAFSGVNLGTPLINTGLDPSKEAEPILYELNNYVKLYAKMPDSSWYKDRRDLQKRNAYSALLTTDTPEGGWEYINIHDLNWKRSKEERLHDKFEQYQRMVKANEVLTRKHKMTKSLRARDTGRDKYSEVRGAEEPDSDDEVGAMGFSASMNDMVRNERYRMDRSWMMDDERIDELTHDLDYKLERSRIAREREEREWNEVKARDDENKRVMEAAMKMGEELEKKKKSRDAAAEVVKFIKTLPEGESAEFNPLVKPLIEVIKSDDEDDEYKEASGGPAETASKKKDEEPEEDENSDEEEEDEAAEPKTPDPKENKKKLTKDERREEQKRIKQYVANMFKMKLHLVSCKELGEAPKTYGVGVNMSANVAENRFYYWDVEGFPKMPDHYSAKDALTIAYMGSIGKGQEAGKIIKADKKGLATVKNSVHHPSNNGEKE